MEQFTKHLKGKFNGQQTPPYANHFAVPPYPSIRV